jgi:hypothetical protein
VGLRVCLPLTLAAVYTKGESVSGYIWNTLILGNHELALISQWMIGVPVLTLWRTRSGLGSTSPPAATLAILFALGSLWPGHDGYAKKEIRQQAGRFGGHHLTRVQVLSRL